MNCHNMLSMTSVIQIPSWILPPIVFTNNAEGKIESGLSNYSHSYLLQLPRVAEICLSLKFLN